MVEIKQIVQVTISRLELELSLNGMLVASGSNPARLIDTRASSSVIQRPPMPYVSQLNIPTLFSNDETSLHSLLTRRHMSLQGYRRVSVAAIQ